MFQVLVALHCLHQAQQHRSIYPTVEPSDEPCDEPSDEPSDEPTDEPCDEPTDEPIDEPTDEPIDEPTDEPSDEPSDDPAYPTDEPSPSPSPSSKPTPLPPRPSTGDLKAQIIYQTSVIRAAHGLGPVSWNDDLAIKMQAWADSAPQKTGGGHGGPPGNQNLASFIICNDNCMSTTGPAWDWYSGEEKLWNYDTNESQDGNWMTTGHFSNSMDPGVNEIACGYSTFPNPSIGNKDDSLVWCNYLGGNNGKIPRPLVDQDALEKQLRGN
ncbi:hypothetical protein ACHHYP_09680 [Achlya hypogyna]|uniref:SCP domain-containing protein n=1 Tax=Achlya hypogyna TaxID=1202772 RepID=A0A1V9ZIU2_ACHHY|nr:hypothetical protein ACHHYP_09680 [Achlya hypogyna]